MQNPPATLWRVDPGRSSIRKPMLPSLRQCQAGVPSILRLLAACGVRGAAAHGIRLLAGKRRESRGHPGAV